MSTFTPAPKTSLKERLLSQAPPGTSRRDFLQLMGAVIVMGSLEGCREHDPVEEVIPFARTPESALSGPYSHFSTTLTTADSVLGVRVTSHQGRPIKIEGNPLHPFGRGSTNAIAQGALYDLYDPHRAAQITELGEEPRDWPQFRRALARQLERHAKDEGAGLRFVIPLIQSPTEQRLLTEVLKKFPKAFVVKSTLLPMGAAVEGARQAFGRDVVVVRDFSKPDVVVLFDDERFGQSAEGLRECRDWMERRSVDRVDFHAKQKSSTLFVAEPTWTFAGGVAEKRLPTLRSRVAILVNRLCAHFKLCEAGHETLSTEEAVWLTSVIANLDAAKEKSLIAAGPAQSASVHEWICRLNIALKSTAVSYVEKTALTPGLLPAAKEQTLASVIQDLKAKRVETLLLLGGNPVYDVPGDLDLRSAIPLAGFSVYLGAYVNESSRVSRFHVPQAHELEVWSDLESADGTTGIVQPLISPLYNGRTMTELLAVCLAGDEAKDNYTLTRETWQQRTRKNEFEFENWWRDQLRTGVVDLAQTARLDLKPIASTKFQPPISHSGSTNSDAVEIIFQPDFSVWDGRHANNAWLQELPRPFSELTWDNVASISNTLAKKLDVKDGDVLRITASGREISIPVHVVDGLHEKILVLTLGYGSETTGIGNGVGVNVGPIRQAESPWAIRNAKLEKTGKRYALAFTQKTSRIDDASALQVMTPAVLAQRKDAKSAGLVADPETPVMMDQRPQRWGMTIDLDTCIGCRVCTIACQVENNIPVVGKTQVLLGREMHWIRIDRYTREVAGAVKIDPMPVPCMQCEKAPCEYVCPVNASVHSSDGLNEQVYNRCIGTRFCANNCPYKVRRFNFIQYSGFAKEASLRLAYNPDVTVRDRGVMEKCTYCIQRINRVRLRSEIDKTEMKDGDIQTACQQACPTKAIVFGDLNDQKSLVRKLKQLPREFSLLEDLGTAPRTTYLARIER